MPTLQPGGLPHGVIWRAQWSIFAQKIILENLPFLLFVPLFLYRLHADLKSCRNSEMIIFTNLFGCSTVKQCMNGQVAKPIWLFNGKIMHAIWLFIGWAIGQIVNGKAKLQSSIQFLQLGWSSFVLRIHLKKWERIILAKSIAQCFVIWVFSTVIGKRECTFVTSVKIWKTGIRFATQWKHAAGIVWGIIANQDEKKI